MFLFIYLFYILFFVEYIFAATVKVKHVGPKNSPTQEPMV